MTILGAHSLQLSRAEVQLLLCLCLGGDPYVLIKGVIHSQCPSIFRKLFLLRGKLAIFFVLPNFALR